MKKIFLSVLIPFLASGQDSQFVISGEIESTVWAGESPTPGLFEYDDDLFFAPRFRLSADALLSPQWFLHAGLVWDRGFDSGSHRDGQVRLDELILRFRPFGDNRLNFQLGKFPTVFGNWVPHHDFHDDAFLLPPLPYNQITGVHPFAPAAISPAAIARREAEISGSIFDAPKRNWASTIWGPSYSSGIAIFGSERKFDYAFELKNSALSSQPAQWDPSWNDYQNPTFSARLGYRPDAAWALGLSFSRGPYLEPQAERLLPAGLDRGDLAQTLIGLDLRWAHRDVIVSGEVIASEFETLEAGDLRSLSYYLQARWKVSPGFWLAARFGQTFHNSTDTSLEWSPDHWRAEISAGYRITPDLLLKAQYLHTQAKGDPPGFANNLGGFGIGWRF